MAASQREYMEGLRKLRCQVGDREPVHKSMSLAERFQVRVCEKFGVGGKAMRAWLSLAVIGLSKQDHKQKAWEILITKKNMVGNLGEKIGLGIWSQLRKTLSRPMSI